MMVQSKRCQVVTESRKKAENPADGHPSKFHTGAARVKQQ